MPEHNQRHLKTVLNNDPILVTDDGYGRLFGLAGEFCFQSKITGAIEHRVRYKDVLRADLGRCAAYVQVWSRLAPSGLSAQVLLDHALDGFDTLIAGDVTTEGARRFWQRIVVTSLGRGLTVGVLGARPYFYDPSTNFDAWLDVVKANEKRYFISRKALLRSTQDRL